MNLFGQMWGSDYWGSSMWGPGFGPFGFAMFGFFMLALAVWSIYWKYHAIWYAVKHDDKWWFLAFLVINTFGILEIIYLYVITKKTPSHDDKNLPMVP